MRELTINPKSQVRELTINPKGQVHELTSAGAGAGAGAGASWSYEKLHALQVLTDAIWEIQKLVKTVMANRNEDTDKNIGKHISRLARSPEFFGAKFEVRGFLKLLRFPILRICCRGPHVFYQHIGH